MKEKKLGKYQLHEELGRGGFATVYRASHETLGTEVAVKVLNPALSGDEDARKRFIQEAQTASQLEHPHIVRVEDLFDNGECVFLAMEYLPGGDLTAWLETRAPVERAERLRILGEVAEALDYAHQQGVMHRDVKPTNVLMDSAGRAYLCDFGLVRVNHTPRMTKLGHIVGTANYVSPEQAEGKNLDGRADQYSLAVMAYELLVGEVPFQGESATSISLMHVTKPPPTPSERNSEVPREADEVLLKALSKPPQERYQTCAAFVDALSLSLEASRRRRYRELMEEARSLLDAGDYQAVGACLEQARRVLPDRPESRDALAELETARQGAAKYGQMVEDWQSAHQKAEDALSLSPEHPDPKGTLVTLGLRKPARKIPPPAEILRQSALGLGLGLPVAALMLYFAFLYLTR